jgi:hypothetical protein
MEEVGVTRAQGSSSTSRITHSATTMHQTLGRGTEDSRINGHQSCPQGPQCRQAEGQDGD